MIVVGILTIGVLLIRNNRGEASPNLLLPNEFGSLSELIRFDVQVEVSLRTAPLCPVRLARIRLTVRPIRQGYGDKECSRNNNNSSYKPVLATANRSRFRVGGKSTHFWMLQETGLCKLDILFFAFQLLMDSIIHASSHWDPKSAIENVDT